MRPSKRKAVSTYLETFILVGVAAGCSGVVMGTALHLFGSFGAESISLVGVSIRQGTYTAVESVTLVGSGSSSIPTFFLSTSEAPSSEPYCLLLVDPANDVVLSDSCEGHQTNPGTVEVVSPVGSGDELTVQLVIMGEAFVVGSSHTVTITAEDGSQQSVQVLVTSG